ncbi:MAG TPA: TolC family protein [Cellvibrio sp.]|nr:TolC family protein [Cellvibrio sp.]
MQFIHRALTVSVIAISCSAYAASSAAQSTLTLSEAVRATLQQNPQLAGYTFKVNALAGEKQTAALRPEYRLSTDLENVAGSGEFSGTETSELTISLSSAIELGGQRDARMNVVTARQQQLQSTQRVLTLDVITAVTHQFIQLLTAQEQLALQEESHQLIQQTLHSLTRQVQAGGTADSELLRGNAALALSNIALQQARQIVSSERVKLSAYWADSSPDFTAVKADLYAVPTAQPLPTLLEKLSGNPDLEQLTKEVNIRIAEVQQARSERRPSLEWNAGVRRLQATEDSAVVLGLSMPLGAGNRAGGAITTANANQQSAELERDSARVQLEAQLISAYEAHRQAIDEVNVLRDQVLPSLKKAMRSTASAFDQGRYSYMELNLAQSQLLDAQQALVEAASRMQETRIELERMIGSALNEQNVEVTQ